MERRQGKNKTSIGYLKLLLFFLFPLVLLLVLQHPWQNRKKTFCGRGRTSDNKVVVHTFKFLSGIKGGHWQPMKTWQSNLALQVKVIPLNSNQGIWNTDLFKIKKLTNCVALMSVLNKVWNMHYLDLFACALQELSLPGRILCIFTPSKTVYVICI